MKNLWRALVAVAVLSLPLAAADLTGTWKLEGEVVGNPIKGTCEWKQEGETLSGVCKLENGQAPKITGEVKEKALFHFDVDHEGATYTLNFSGILDGDKAMKGDIEVAGMAGEFTAKKE